MLNSSGSIKNHSKKEENIYMEDKEMNIIRDKVMTAIISGLLKVGILKPEDLTNKIYTREKVIENFDRYINNTRVHIETHHDFLEACKSEFSNARPESGIVMASVCLENMINLFYRYLLTSGRKFEDGEIDRILQVLSIRDKITWFYKIAFANQLPNRLVDKILEINSLRNKIVHFKAVPDDNIDTANGSAHQIQTAIQSLSIEYIEAVIINLEKEFEKIEKELSPCLESCL